MAGPQGQHSFAPSQFMAKVDKLGGIARKNRFSIEITPPSTLVSGIQASTINFLAKTVSFPARAFGTTTYRSGGQFGLEVPYEATFEPMSVTMLNTNDYAPRIFWTDWLEHIQNMNTYNMQYYKKFIGTIKIQTYSEDQTLATTPKHEVTLHEAWPKSMGSIELGWEASDLAEFDIDIAYSWWTGPSNA